MALAGGNVDDCGSGEAKPMRLSSQAMMGRTAKNVPLTPQVYSVPNAAPGYHGPYASPGPQVYAAPDTSLASGYHGPYAAPSRQVYAAPNACRYCEQPHRSAGGSAVS
jgi:hypothetical protein